MRLVKGVGSDGAKRTVYEGTNVIIESSANTAKCLIFLLFFSLFLLTGRRYAAHVCTKVDTLSRLVSLYSVRAFFEPSALML